MPLHREDTAASDSIQYLLRRIESLEEQIRMLKQPGPTTIQAIDTDDYEDPVQGELVIHWPD